MKKIIPLFLTLLLVTGCGKEAEQNEDKTNLTESEITTEIMQPESEARTEELELGVIPEHVDDVFTLQDGMIINVDADIRCELVEPYTVYKVEKKGISIENVKNIADGFFDDGKYNVIETDIPNDYGENIIEHVDEVKSSEVKWYRSVVTTVWEEQKDIESITLTGLKNNKEFVIDFYQKENGQLISGYVKAIDNAKVFLRALDNDSAIASEAANNLTISNTDAESNATELIDLLGLGDFKIVTSYTAKSMDGSDVTYGYKVLLSTDYMGAAARYTRNDELIDAEQMFSRFLANNSKEYIEVLVTDEGVTGFTLLNINTIVQEKANGISLVDFNKIKEASRNGFVEVVEAGTNEMCIDKITLSYREVAYEDGFSVVPCWFYDIKNDVSSLSSAFQNPFVIVNALDGTAIY